MKSVKKIAHNLYIVSILHLGIVSVLFLGAIAYSALIVAFSDTTSAGSLLSWFLNKQSISFPVFILMLLFIGLMIRNGKQISLWLENAKMLKWVDKLFNLKD